MLSLILLSTLLRVTTGQISTLKTYLPGSPLNHQVIQASGQAFYLGLEKPTTYCPEIVEPFCPNVTQTIVAGAMAAMYVRIPFPPNLSSRPRLLFGSAADGVCQVNVPGGQQIWVRPDGWVGYTQAHSASVPTGAYRGGFANVTITSECDPTVDVFAWKTPGESSEGILACPDLPDYMVNSPATHQIYVRTPEFKLEDCVELEGLLATSLPSGSAFGAWQYV
ncbi:hypothetical protein VTL71DRAFT_10166 [Oculimacula yallundae]|uniref:IgE-binding protein n=1 Tax=Oculimacula yallundae TaxID=86028 RepID=A0ABR4BPS6_9HELO